MIIASPIYPVECQAVDLIYVNPDGQHIRCTQVIQHGQVKADKFCKDWHDFARETAKRNLPVHIRGTLVTE